MKREGLAHAPLRNMFRLQGMMCAAQMIPGHDPESLNRVACHPMNNARILVVDDEPQIRRVLRTTLFSAGYEVTDAKNGQEAIETVVREHPDLILLDVNMPGMTGFEVCSRIRLSFDGPILMVTVRNSERDKIEALNAGADDYIVKPFTMGELLARIRAALRRSTAGQPLPKIETAELTVDLENRIVEVRGSRAHMTPKEFEVLRTLVIRQGEAVTHNRILQRTATFPVFRPRGDTLTIACLMDYESLMDRAGLLNGRFPSIVSL